MIGYTRKVGLRKPGTWEWALSMINPNIRLRSVEAQEFLEYQAGHLNPAQVESLALATGGIIEGPDATPVPTRDPHWLRDQVYRSAATLDGLPPEMRETLAHRTWVKFGQHEHEWTFNETHLEMVCACGAEKQNWLRGGS